MGSTTDESQSSDTLKQYLKLINDFKKNLAHVSHYLKSYSKMEPNSLASVSKMQSMISKIEKIVYSMDEGNLRRGLENWLDEEGKKLKSIDLKLRLNFAEKLYNLLVSEGFKLEGHIPNLKTSFYSLEIDFDKNQCKISYGQDKEYVANLVINPQEISNFIIQHKQKLDKSYQKSEDFASQLERAYSLVIKKLGKGPDKKAPIIDVMLELAIQKQQAKFLIDPLQKNFENYGRIQFSYDLYRLIQNPPQESLIKLSTATRAQAQNRRNYLWIPKNDRGEGAIYSHVEVVRERNV